MSKEYVQHNRPLTSEQAITYGKLATHDIHVPILVLYELGKIPDKNGTIVDIDKDFINETMRISNKYIKDAHSSIFNKFKSSWTESIDNYEVVPLIKNHDTGDVDGTVGYTRGLFYTEEVTDEKGNKILALYVKGVITDPEAKKKVENGILKNVSIGTRPTGSIKEISFVVNPAVPHAGLVMSEPDQENTIPENNQIQLTEKEIQLTEEIKGLQLEEALYEHTIIPNHLILSNLIKKGKLPPPMYEKLINTTNREALELMEEVLPYRDLGIMFGTTREPEKIDLGEAKIKQIASDWNKRIGKDSIEPEMIRQTPNTEESRKRELKHILELAEHSPDIAAKYIKYELGEEVEDSKYKDTLLTEYLDKLAHTKTKLKQLQLGE